jgi:hypothetical protein
MVSGGTLVVRSLTKLRACLARGGLGWVSAELHHLHASHNWGPWTVGVILLLGASFMFNEDKNKQNNISATDGVLSVDFGSLDVDVAMTAACWLGLLDSSHGKNLFSRPLLTFSGETKASPSELCHCPKTKISCSE